jgi:molybdopterin-containing oxidoreductase family membrane subunit
MREEAPETVYTPPLIGPGHNYRTLTEKISGIVLTTKTPLQWFALFGVGFVGTMLLMFALSVLLVRGIGIWGVNVPIAWGFAIVNFVWWIGIGHAGTLISAILLLLHQAWRQSINRFAEAMTLFAVTCAGIFPLAHLGRPWFFYWLVPYPNTMGLWPQWRSPLVWDVFAVSTYFTISLVFWFIGLIPDLATMRDRSRNRFARVTYGILAMGWRGSAHHWHNYESLYVLLAGLATPLVISVHTVVSFDFTISIVPGWHSTMFPPYFVAGAIYSGFAMVLTLAIPLRKLYRLEDLITTRHIQNMAKLMLATGMIVAYSYVIEAFMSWYSADQFERYVSINRATGPYAWLYWALVAANIVIPQALWSERVRKSTPAIFAIAVCVNIGMWLERFIIVITSLHRDFLPANWRMYYPTIWDWATFGGTIGLFIMLFFLFVRVLPMISIFEMKQIVEKPEVGVE